MSDAMIRRHSSVVSAIALVVTAFAAASACSDDRPGPAAVSSSSSGSSGASGSSGSGTSGSSGSSSGDMNQAQLCEGTLQRAEEIPEQGVAGDAPPPLGGTIEPGTYVLTEADAYGMPPPPPNSEPDPIVLTGVKVKKTLFIV